MWPAQHFQQYHQPEAGLVFAVTPQQQPEQQYVQPAMHQQTYGGHVVQHPLDIQQPSLQAHAFPLQRHQQLWSQPLLQQPAQHPQNVAGYSQTAPQWQQQQLSAGQRVTPHAQGMLPAVTPLPAGDATVGWQQRQIIQRAPPQQQYIAHAAAAAQTPSLQQQQYLHQDSNASDWQQEQQPFQQQQPPAAAAHWHHQQQYELQQQHLHLHTLPLTAHPAPIAVSVAANGEVWQQHRQRPLPQHHQPAEPPHRYPAADTSVVVPPQPVRPATAQRSYQRQQKHRPQQGQQEQKRQQQQQEHTSTTDFDFDQWQQQSSKWRTQGRQMREAEQQQQQERKPPLHKQKQQHITKQQSQQRQQAQEQGHASKQQGRQQQQQSQEPVAEQQPVKLSKAQRRARNKLLLQQQQQQQQQQTQQQEPFPLLKLPPRVIVAITDLLPEPQQLMFAQLLPQSSAAAAAIWGKFSVLHLGKPKGVWLYDVPECVSRMRGLQQLTTRVWMTGSIQARTGLAALSSLHRLTQLELSVDVDPEMKLATANKPQQGKKKQTNKLNRRKYGAEAAPQPSLTQQLDEQLLNPTVKIQEDLWQITSAVGKLNNLQVLSLICCNNSNCNSKQVFRQLGYQSLTPLSSLTSLVSLHIRYSVCQVGAGLACLTGLTGITSLSLEEDGGVEITDGEPGVAALSGFWQRGVQLQQLLLRSPCLGPEVVRQLRLNAEALRVLNVSGCKGLFPSFRTWGHLRRLQGLQELHASNCNGITAADLETVASSLASSLTYLDISHNTAQPDGGDLRGSIDALGRLTNLQHLNAFGSCIAPVGDGSEGGVCSVLAQLSQLTFLSVGSVHRSVMVMPSADVAQLSVMTQLRKLQLAGAQLGVGLDYDTDSTVLLSRLEFLKSLVQLIHVRLWACRFSNFSRGHMSDVLRTQVLQRLRLQKKHCTVVDGQWYPDRFNAVHDEPADYSGDEEGGPTAATAAVQGVDGSS